MNRTWNLNRPAINDFTPEELAGIDPSLYPYLFDEWVSSSDEFRMYGFKVKRCPRMRSHDWTSCPFSHRGEKARRRDPRRHRYAASVCPDFCNNYCVRGDGCGFAHGVFEFWLHPTMYRTRPCNSGRTCRRKVCFFAHSPHELRDEAKYHCFIDVGGGGGAGAPVPGSVPSATAMPFVPRARAAVDGTDPCTGSLPPQPGRRQNCSGGGGHGQSSSGGDGGGGRRSGGGDGSPDFLASLSGLNIREGDGSGRGIFPWGGWGPMVTRAAEEEGDGLPDSEWITDWE